MGLHENMTDILNVVINISRTLDDVPHHDTNTDINVFWYTCHKMCRKKILKCLNTCSVRENAYMVIGFRARRVYLSTRV